MECTGSVGWSGEIRDILTILSDLTARPLWQAYTIKPLQIALVGSKCLNFWLASMFYKSGILIDFKRKK